MTKRRKELKRIVATEESTGAVFTEEELRSRLEVAVREALHVVEQHHPLSSGDAFRAEEQLHIVSDLEH